MAKRFNVELLAQIPLNEKICEECDYGKLLAVLESKGIKDTFANIIKKINQELPV